jgi:hypothetical protein
MYVERDVGELLEVLEAGKTVAFPIPPIFWLTLVFFSSVKRAFSKNPARGAP